MADKKPTAKKPTAAKPTKNSTTSKQNGAGLRNGDGSPVEMITLERDVFGNPYLPGNEVTVPKELYEAVHTHESSKVDFDKAKKAQTKAQQNLAASSIKFRSLFEGTKDGLHFTFNCAGVDIFVDRNEKVSTKPESSVKAGKRGKKKAAEEKAVADVY